MSSPLDLEIGRILFTITSSCPLLPQDELPSYAEFINPPRRGGPDSEITLLPLGESVADPPAKALLFDSGSAWKVFRDGDDYLISFDSAGANPHPFWRVRASGDFSHCEVACGRELVREMHGVTAIRNPVRYPLDQILLMHLLARRNGAILHAAGATLGGRGIIFPGRSGAGKSTISACLMGRKDYSILSDDRVVVRLDGGVFKIFGTPWPGSAGIARNEKALLSGIFFIGRGDAPRITRIDPGEAIERLLPVTSIPWYDRDLVPRALAFLEELVTRTPAFQLLFRPGPEVADALAEFVSA